MESILKEDDQQFAACLRLAAMKLSNRCKQRLLEHFVTPQAIFDASIDELKALLPVNNSTLRKAVNETDEALIEQQLTLLTKHKINILLHHSPDYPPLLKQIEDAPPILFTRGDVNLLCDPQLAMVGSRNASPSGLKTARAFAAEFAASGLTVTSGLAAGIDTEAHKGALDEIGRTLAVVATGLDEVYPRSNLPLARAIVKKGCMVSEFPPMTPARRAHFPQRNRIISGLSLGVLVVEADTRSGSLITARLAGEQGREIFAIPGSIHSPTSRGCHQLIRQGAKLVETTADVLLEIKTGLEIELHAARNRLSSGVEKKKKLDPESIKVLNQVDFAPTRLGDIAIHSNLPIELVLSELLQLELAGEVAPLPGGQYQRIQS
jgi:DNA processing protein